MNTEKLSLDQNLENVRTMLAERQAIVDEIARVEGIGGEAEAESNRLGTEALEDDSVGSRIAILSARSAAAGGKLSELRTSLAEFDARFEAAVDAASDSGLHVFGAIELARYEKFKKSVSPHFDGGSAHKAFHRNPHGLGGAIVLEWFKCTSAFLNLDYPRRQIGGLHSRWSTRPALARAEELIAAALASIPSDLDEPEPGLKAVAKAVQAAAVAVAGVIGLRL